MSAFTLGSINPLKVEQWTGFDYPERAQVIPLLGTTASSGNAVIQQSALTFPEATIGGTLTSSSDIATLRTYAADKSAGVTFTEDDGTTTHSVVVMDLVISRIFISVWTYTCRLVEVA